ncbi:MAG: DUF481 domain-containing protein [Crocosphaera sp.]
MANNLNIIWNLILDLLLMTILWEKKTSLAMANSLSEQAFAVGTLPEISSSLNQPFSESFSSVLWIASEFEYQSKLSQILDTVNQMEDSSAKVKLLNNIAIKYIRLGEKQKAESILAQSLTIIKSLDDPNTKVNLWLKIAQAYVSLNQDDKAKEILVLATETANRVEDKLTQGRLLLEIALEYDLMGLEKTSEDLWFQSEAIILETLQPSPAFPFTELPSTLSLGLVGNVNSFRDTTAFLGATIDYYKQWSTSDFSFDGDIAVSFDSSRTTNNYRPTSLSEMTYRHHFNETWNFFTDLFVVTNQDLFASRNDDEDLTIVGALLVGAGLNLWRGETPRQFLDAQFGIGARYQYDFVDFEERENEVSPILGFVLLGRNFQLGRLTIDETFAITPSINDFGNLIISSDTKVSFPINENWSLVNRLFIRHRRPEVFEENPALEFYFTTGVDYKF